MSTGGTFTSRWGLMLAMLGMAVGTGNIWRFPRIAASHGGGTFLVAWVFFLVAWSIPLIVAEFAMGKAFRMGPVGTFRKLLGARFGWLGAWIAWVVVAIGIYYATVMGWTLRFLGAAVAGDLLGHSEELWTSLAFSPVSVVFQALAVCMGAAVVYFGVGGIERVARILMPTLVVLIAILAVRAVTLPGASRGLEFLFVPDWSELVDARVWLEALAQNAWDTGAGWGLVLTYAVYTRPREDTNLNSVLLATGNNFISLTAGVLVLSTIFAVRPEASSEIVGAGNEGLTFVWVPRLFETIPGGAVFMVLFFLALVFAAWTSFVAIFELCVRALEEIGNVNRRRAMPWIALTILVAGLPPALSEPVFRNQDFVWSVALMVTGLVFALTVLHYGVSRFRREFVDTDDQDFHAGRLWEWAIRLVVVEATVMIVWWIWQSRGQPLWSREGVGNMFTQWGLSMLILAVGSWWFLRRPGRPKTTDST